MKNNSFLRNFNIELNEVFILVLTLTIAFLCRVQSRLVGWKFNLLSFTGRLVLTQAVTTTIPNYAMQCVALLVKILTSIDRLSRNFLWGSSKSKKKIHLVSWKKITKSKKEGGGGGGVFKQQGKKTSQA